MSAESQHVATRTANNVVRVVEDAVKDAKDAIVMNKQSEVVAFSSTAIALYGYDQGMMSLINTNHDYLATMGINSTSPLVGVIVAVYYVGCAIGAVLGSKLADLQGRKRAIFACICTTCLGNLIMFFSGFGFQQGAMTMMIIGRIVLGVGVGAFDAVIPVISAELQEAETRGEYKTLSLRKIHESVRPCRIYLQGPLAFLLT